MELQKLILPLRIAQTLCSLIVLATTAYVSSWWSNYWRDMSPPEINFLVFTSSFSLLISLPFLIFVPSSTKFSRFAPKVAVLGVECVSLTFWFAGFVALAVFLGSRICFGNVCNVAKVGAAFGGFNWALFAATTIIAVVDFIRPRSSAAGGSKVVDDTASIDDEEEESKKDARVEVKEVRDGA